MRRLLFAAALLISCAHVPGAGARAACTTPCGMTSIEGDCESLQRFEGRALRRLSRWPSPYDLDVSCSKLKGWRIVIRRHDETLDKGCSELGWRLTPDFCASGLTKWSDKTITLTSTDWEHNALAHELVHVLEGEKVPAHCRWSESWLRYALEDITGDVDTNPPEKECVRR